MVAERQRTVGILIFDDVEVLDFCGPFEVFSVAEWPGQPDGAPGPFRALLIAEQPGVVRTTGGMLVQPHHTVADHPPLDLLVVPGGFGTRKEQRNPVLLEWIGRQVESAEVVTSVCTGAFLLAGAGLLTGRPATTHWGSIERMQADFPDVRVVADRRIVDEGRVVTSAGISAGIDMALHIVERLEGLEVARWTARLMEYDWRR